MSPRRPRVSYVFPLQPLPAEIIIISSIHTQVDIIPKLCLYHKVNRLHSSLSPPLQGTHANIEWWT